ncbi:MAG: DUF924 domain-containing protein [Proteobacteria bacterium]|nr:DUF924 domain-containing protein [Pseudomonadota bacterium]
MVSSSIDKIIHFWFMESKPEQWFKKDEAYDSLIAERFSSLHGMAASCELYGWRDKALGRLAEIIILDQFSRNIYRDTPNAFACDSLALSLSQEALRTGASKSLGPQQRAFFYMPFMHSESSSIHEVAVELFSEPGMENNLEFELRHKEIIDRFGRYPHRNDILGRESTPEEIEFLETPGSSF